MKRFFGCLAVLCAMTLAGGPARAGFLFDSTPSATISGVGRQEVRETVDREMMLAGYRLSSTLVSEAVYVRPLSSSLEGKLVLSSGPELKVTYFFEDIHGGVQVRASIEIIMDGGRLDLTRSRQAHEIDALLGRVKSSFVPASSRLSP